MPRLLKTMSQEMSNSDHPRMLKVVFPLLRVAAYLLFLFFAAPLRVFGSYRVPRHGPLLVISNHISNTDPVVVQYACPRLIHFLARKELFDMGLLGRFTKWWGAVPIRQSSADKGAIKSAVQLLREGQAVGIFPEGQLSPDGNLIELLEGTALIVRLSGAPCVCLGLRGSNKMMPCPSVIPRWAFASVQARWGEVKTFCKDSTTEEVMSWVEAELRSLTDQTLE